MPHISHHSKVEMVEILYRQIAIFKVLLQLLFSFVIVYFCVPKFTKSSIILWAFVLALFQNGSYFDNMGIVDNSITYVFFYAFPLFFLFIFFGIIFRKWISLDKLNNYEMVGMVCCSIFISFFGAINFAVNLLLSGIIIIGMLMWNRMNKKELKLIDKSLIFLLLVHISINLYSYYLGQHNSENLPDLNPIKERYCRLIFGLFFMMKSKLADLVMYSFLIINYILIQKFGNAPLKSKTKLGLVFLAMFCISYLILLPFGGYRDYRSNYIRYDTYIPISILLISFNSILIYQLSTIHFKFKSWYFGYCFVVFLIFVNADLTSPPKNSNGKEKEELLAIASSNEPKLYLQKHSEIFNWGYIDSNYVKVIDSSLKKIGIISPNQRLVYPYK